MDPGTMSGDQNFYLALLGLIFGSISAIVTAILTYLTNKSRNEAKRNMQESRENLGELAKAVNGKSQEAVANARLAGILEGMKLQLDREKGPLSEAKADKIVEQATVDARVAALKSSAVAHNAASKILEVPQEYKK